MCGREEIYNMFYLTGKSIESLTYFKPMGSYLTLISKQKIEVNTNE